MKKFKLIKLTIKLSNIFKNMPKNIIKILFFIFFFQKINIVYSNQNFDSLFLSHKDELSEAEQNLQKSQIINAIYIIRNKNEDKNLDIENGIPTFLNNPKKYLKKHFRIIRVDKNTNRPTNLINSDDYFYIEDKDQSKRIGISNQAGDIKLYDSPKGKNIGIDDNCLWKIYPKILDAKYNDKNIKKIFYYFQNKGNGKYLSYVSKNDKGILKCDFQDINKFTDKNYFILHRMYREKNPNESSEILNKEPIDVLIKYIDLSDPNLKREGISQIKKDEDNGEILYAVRSIIKYIPWIRKIFILMPNEKVKYFKDPEEIKDKIVYVKDKDLLGFDSASSPAFQFNLWRMKQFGLSENFILMDDDCFIGKPLKKSNFFYEENGKVYPALITGDYYELNKKTLESALKPLLAKIKNTGSHTPNGFSIMQKSTLLFLYSIFGDDDTRYGHPLIEAAFSHNAIAVCQSDIKEIYDYVVNLYPYANETLKAKTRHIRSLQPQTIFLSYPKNKHDRIVKRVSSKFFDLTQFKGKVDTELYVINTSDKKYSLNYYKNEITNLQKIYPEKTPYEVDPETIKIESQKKDEKKEEKKDEKKDIKKDEKKVENDKKDEKKKENEKEQKDNDISKEENDKFYETILEYLKNSLKEKSEFNKEILEIKEQINHLSKEYDKKEKEIEEIMNKYNKLIKNNITLSHNKENNSKYKFKFLEIIIFIAIIGCFIMYLHYKGQLNINNNTVNYSDINSFGKISEGVELNSMTSKLLLS